MTTSKNTKKRSRSTQKAFIVKVLAKKHGVTEALVYMALRGDRKTDLAENIKRDYARLTRAIQQVCGS
jgi:hypothetical protein